jgi:protocatechuate 3,4-dioxygenase beta subunit
MHNDDRPIGRLLSRREALSLVGATTAASLAHGRPARAVREVPLQSLDCIALPEQTEGPFFIDEAPERSDIRVDPASGRANAGAPLGLRFVLSQMSPDGDCAVLPGARVDIWHCDAMGVYSDVEDRSSSTAGHQVLRGYQVSDAQGVVRFTTIYPGWYRGRAVHVHFKIRVPAPFSRADEFTSQLYFPDELTDRVHTQEPYTAHRGQRLLNARDMIYRENGAPLVLPVVEDGRGFAATFRIAMQPGQPRRTSGEGPRRPRRT